ncbi:mcb, partial [Symbiodinium necroappetens]
DEEEADVEETLSQIGRLDELEESAPVSRRLLLGDMVVSGIIVPALIIVVLAQTGVYTPQWTLLWDTTDTGSSKAILSHGAVLTTCWVTAALATGAYGIDSVRRTDLAKFLKSIWKTTAATAFLLALCAVLPLLLSGSSGSNMTDFDAARRFQKTFFDLLCDVELSAVCLTTWRLYYGATDATDWFVFSSQRWPMEANIPPLALSPLGWYRPRPLEPPDAVEAAARLHFAGLQTVLLRHGLNLEQYTADPCAPHGMVLTELFSLADGSNKRDSVILGLVYAFLTLPWDRQSVPGYLDYVSLIRMLDDADVTVRALVSVSLRVADLLPSCRQRLQMLFADMVEARWPKARAVLLALQRATSPGDTSWPGAEKKDYILKTLDPILEEMVSDVLAEMPNVPMDFMIQWLIKRTGRAADATERVSVFQKNHNLKQELRYLQGSLEEASTAAAAPAEEEEEEEDDDDDCDEIPESFRKSEESMGKTRTSVSAEAYGTWNQKKAFTPPDHPKTDEQKQRLKQTLSKSFMFSSLEDKDMTTILGAMKECKFAAGQKVINEGDNGDFLFVIEKGQLECIKASNGEDKVVKTVNEGDVFGELALLYNCPRAASVVAKDECICWELDRESFNYIVKDAAVARRNKYDEFLQSVTLLASLEAYERSQIADALKPEKFQKGDCIVKQDDPGDKFYIVEEGTLYALKDIDGSSKRVMDYKVGDYFGELALLKNQPRAGSVIVESENAKVLSMSRLSFNKMLGPLAELLSSKADLIRSVLNLVKVHHAGWLSSDKTALERTLLWTLRWISMTMQDDNLLQLLLEVSTLLARTLKAESGHLDANLHWVITSCGMIRQLDSLRNELALPASLEPNKDSLAHLLSPKESEQILYVMKAKPEHEASYNSRMGGKLCSVMMEASRICSAAMILSIGSRICDHPAARMGLALSQLAECPIGTRLLLALYASCSSTPWLLNAVGLDTRVTTTKLFACCLANVLKRKQLAPVLLSALHRPLYSGSDALLALTELQASISFMPFLEQELGSLRFLVWLLVNTGGSNLFFLFLMSLLQKQGRYSADLRMNYGLWSIGLCALTQHALDLPDMRTNLLGLVEVPYKWYPLSITVALSVFSGSVQWETLSAVSFAYLWRALSLDRVFLPSRETAQKLEAKVRVPVAGLASLLGGRWVPASPPGWRRGIEVPRS